MEAEAEELSGVRGKDCRNVDEVSWRVGRTTTP